MHRWLLFNFNIEVFTLACGRTPNKYMLFVVKQASSRQQSEPQAHEHEGSAFPVIFLSSCLSRENIKKKCERAAWERGKLEMCDQQAPSTWLNLLGYIKGATSGTAWVPGSQQTCRTPAGGDCVSAELGAANQDPLCWPLHLV